MAEIPPLLAYWYDSVHQRELMLARQRPENLGRSMTISEDVIGQLRWDAIRSPFRVQTHTQLLDGIVFHRLAAAMSIERLGVFAQASYAFPFVVTVVGDGLEDSLKDMLGRGFHFSAVAIDDQKRFELQARLAQIGVEEFERRCLRDGTVEGAVSAISDTGIISVAERDRLRRVWTFWISAEKSGQLYTRPAANYGDDSRSFDLEDFARVPLLTDVGRRVRHRINSSLTIDDRTGVRRRSLVSREIASLTALGDAESISDAETLRHTFDRCYYRQIATVEGAMLSIEGSGQLRGIRRKAALRHARRDRLVVFPHDFKTLLGSMDAHQWSKFVQSIECELNAWWHEWSLEGLQSIGDRLSRISIPVRSSSPLSVTAFVAAASGAAGTLADSSPSGMSLGAGIGLATWIVSDSFGRDLDSLLRRPKLRYDVVEVGVNPVTP